MSDLQTRPGLEHIRDLPDDHEVVQLCAWGDRAWVLVRKPDGGLCRLDVADMVKR